MLWRRCHQCSRKLSGSCWCLASAITATSTIHIRTAITFTHYQYHHQPLLPLTLLLPKLPPSPPAVHLSLQTAVLQLQYIGLQAKAFSLLAAWLRRG